MDWRFAMLRLLRRLLFKGAFALLNTLAAGPRAAETPAACWALTGDAERVSQTYQMHQEDVRPDFRAPYQKDGQRIQGKIADFFGCALTAATK